MSVPGTWTQEDDASPSATIAQEDDEVFANIRNEADEDVDAPEEVGSTILGDGQFHPDDLAEFDELNA